MLECKKSKRINSSKVQSIEAWGLEGEKWKYSCSEYLTRAKGCWYMSLKGKMKRALNRIKSIYSLQGHYCLDDTGVATKLIRVARERKNHILNQSAKLFFWKDLAGDSLHLFIYATNRVGVNIQNKNNIW